MPSKVNKVNRNTAREAQTKMIGKLSSWSRFLVQNVQDLLLPKKPTSHQRENPIVKEEFWFAYHSVFLMRRFSCPGILAQRANLFRFACNCSIQMLKARRLASVACNDSQDAYDVYEILSRNL